MLEHVIEVNKAINAFVWGLPAVGAIVGVGLLLTFRTRFVQIREFVVAMRKTLRKVFVRQDATAGAISPFHAVCTALAGTIGTGNIAGIIAAVLLGGIKRIGLVAGRLIPAMALLYFILALGVLIARMDAVPAAFVSIFKGAFAPKAVTGGVVGSVFLCLQKGVSRGIFSNEAGLGTGSIAHACADADDAVGQGYFGIFEVFMDTIVVCTLTALVILVSGTPVSYGQAAGAELTISGFTAVYGNWVTLLAAVAICCFAFSTTLGWGLYGSRCVEFAFGRRSVKPFLVAYALVSLLGATVDLGVVWDVSETFNGLMAVPNLIALLLLSGKLVETMKGRGRN